MRKWSDKSYDQSHYMGHYSISSLENLQKGVKFQVNVPFWIVNQLYTLIFGNEFVNNEGRNYCQIIIRERVVLVQNNVLEWHSKQ